MGFPAAGYERGLRTLPTEKELKQLELVGADGKLMKAVGVGHAFSAKIGPAIPDGLVKAASDAAEQRFSSGGDRVARGDSDR